MSPHSQSFSALFSNHSPITSSLRGWGPRRRKGEWMTRSRADVLLPRALWSLEMQQLFHPPFVVFMDCEMSRKHMQGCRELVLNMCLIVACMHSSMKLQERGMSQGSGKKKISCGSWLPFPVEIKKVLLWSALGVLLTLYLEKRCS